MDEQWQAVEAAALERWPGAKPGLGVERWDMEDGPRAFKAHVKWGLDGYTTEDPSDVPSNAEAFGASAESALSNLGRVLQGDATVSRELEAAERQVRIARLEKELASEQAADRGRRE